jgi:hypothetical protein
MEAKMKNQKKTQLSAKDLKPTRGALKAKTQLKAGSITIKQKVSENPVGEGS